MDIVKPPKPSVWHRTRSLIVGGACTTLLSCWWRPLVLARPPLKVDRATIWTDAAQLGDMVRELRAAGVLLSKDIRCITAGTIAIVQEVLMLAGAEVQPDTVILRMINPEIQANLAKAVAALAGAEAEVAATLALARVMERFLFGIDVAAPLSP